MTHLPLALLVATLAPAELQDPQPEPPEVPARLISEVTTLAPGAAVDVAVHLAVPDGWHVYWQNPGDTGLPTSVELEAPEGFTVEGPFFPGPLRHVDPGELVSFVLEGDVVVFFRLHAPDELTAERVRLRARAEWLVCQEACFVGSAAPELVLAVGAPAVAAQGPDAELLARQRALLPRPARELPADLHVGWKPFARDEAGPERYDLQLELAGVRSLELFPAPDTGLSLTGRRFEMRKEGARLTLRLERPREENAPPPRLRGVLRMERAAGAAYYLVDLAPER